MVRADLQGEDDISLPEEETTPYALIGGEAGIRRLVAGFYDSMEKPGAAELRALHGPDLRPMREKLFEYLSGAFGGPALYRERPGAKCIMSAHSHFPIDAAMRDQWMMCMREALDALSLPPPARRLFEDGFGRMAEAMRNR